jgi:4,4'-diaponeurosporenoate glycosyltransferase
MHPPHIWAIVAWVIGWILLRRVPRIPQADVPKEGEAGPVTIVIPARNEEASLSGLLEDLAASRPAGAEVVVVDDHSEDRTAEIAAAHDFVTVVAPPPPEPGWTGKANACWFAAGLAKHDTLAFLDADIRFHGDGLDRVLATHRRTGGLVSVFPYAVARRPYEHLNSIGCVLSWMATGHGSWLPPRRPRSAFGMIVVTSREEYFATGGHEAVHDTVVEDIALAERYADAGLPVSVFGGHDVVSSRLYPEGPWVMFQGWTKNLASGVARASPLRVLGLLVWTVCSLGLFTWVGGIVQQGQIKPIHSALYLAYVVQMAVMFRQVGNSRLLSAILYPLQVAFIAAAFLNSLFRTFVLRRLAWRGRSFDRSADAQSTTRRP